MEEVILDSPMLPAWKRERMVQQQYRVVVNHDYEEKYGLNEEKLLPVPLPVT